jgi:3-hydroxyisobutyrate dehydrogenase-like beta-hydroxyacid dehydrogenase
MIAAVAEPRGVRVIDAPVSGTAADAAAGHITLLVGGDEADIEEVSSVLRCYAAPILHVGPLGAGQLVKLLNNALLIANLALVGEITRVSQSVGIDPNAALHWIAQCSGRSRALELADEAGSMDVLYQAFARLLVKDIHVMRTVAQDAQIDLGLLAEAACRYEQATLARTGEENQ